MACPCPQQHLRVDGQVDDGTWHAGFMRKCYYKNKHGFQSKEVESVDVQWNDTNSQTTLPVQKVRLHQTEADTDYVGPIVQTPDQFRYAPRSHAATSVDKHCRFSAWRLFAASLERCVFSA